MEQLLYISESRMDAATADAGVRDIVALSRINNPPVQITGVLLFTGRYFVQILEGRTQPLDRLIEAICQDTRHFDVRIKSRLPITTRNFPDWALAYHGPSQFVERHIVGLLQAETPSEMRRASARLVELAYQFISATVR